MYGIGGTFYFKTGAPTIGLMLTFANYANGLLGPLQIIANYRKSRAAAAESYHSLVQVLAIPNEKSGSEKLAISSIASAGLTLDWQDLRFSYQSQKDEYGGDKWISYPDSHVAANSIYLLKGSSGSGKSTLLKLLFGLYPYDEGMIRVNGMELSALDLRDYRSYLSYIPQEPVLMQGTVRDNLKAVAPEVSDTEMEALLRRLKLSEGSGCLTQGLDTEVGDLGQAISVGQRQRLVIGQGLLRESRLFILDEPNSALDDDSSRELLAILRELREDATILVSSHDSLFNELADSTVDLIPDFP